MKIYYLQAEYAPGKHRIVTALYEKDVFGYDISTLSPYGVLEIDEIGPDNKVICMDIFAACNKIDLEREGKYHIKTGNSKPVIYEKEGWVEYLDE